MGWDGMEDACLQPVQVRGEVEELFGGWGMKGCPHGGDIPSVVEEAMRCRCEAGASRTVGLGLASMALAFSLAVSLS